MSDQGRIVSVKRIEVLCIVHVDGEGTTASPMYQQTSYWSIDGKWLASDPRSCPETTFEADVKTKDEPSDFLDTRRYKPHR